MEQIIIKTPLEQALFDGVFGCSASHALLRNPAKPYKNEHPRSEVYADCSNEMFNGTSNEPFPFKIIRCNGQIAQIYNTDTEKSEWFNFDDIPLARNFKLFVLWGNSINEDSDHCFPICALAPACREQKQLEEFYQLLQPYPDKTAVKYSQQLALFLHRNYVTEEDFKQTSEWHRWNEGEKIFFMLWFFKQGGRYPNAFEALYWL